MNPRQPPIIAVGTHYDQASSRDWAATDVCVTGVETVGAEGFERIDLIDMGVLPSEFLPGITRLMLGRNGTKTHDVVDERTPAVTQTLVIDKRDSSTFEASVTCRLDTAEEVSVYEAG